MWWQEGGTGAVPEVDVATALVIALGGTWGVGCLLRLWVWDVREHRLPNRWTARLALGGLLTAMAFGGVQGDWAPVFGAVTGGLGYAAAMFALRVLSRRQLGMGDVKLAFGLGAYTGAAGVGVTAVAAMLGVVFGGLAAVGAVLLRRATARSALPYGPPMILGALTAVLLAVT